MRTIGDRIAFCRSAIGLTRKELSLLWGNASVPTISRWELDVIVPSTKKISAMADFFSSKGLIVSPAWIESCSGVSPSLLNIKEFNEDVFDEMCEQTILVFNQTIKDFIFYKVTSHFFSPVIRYGDYVGGVKIEEHDICTLNSLAFVVHENTVHVGFLEYDDGVFLKNSHGKRIEFENYNVLGKVNWTAIRP